MTKILQLTFALLLISNVGFGQQESQESNNVSDTCQAQDCIDLSQRILDFCICGMPANRCSELLSYLESEYGNCPPEVGADRSISNQSIKNLQKTLDKTKLAPVTDGNSYGYNITVISRPAGTYLKALRKDGPKIEIVGADSVNLKDYTIELDFKTLNEFNIKILKGNQVDEWKDPKDEHYQTIKPAQSFDVKLLSDYEGGTLPYIVGINDGREAFAGKEYNGLVTNVEPMPWIVAKKS